MAPRKKKEVVYYTAAEWARRMRQWQKMTKEQQHLYNTEKHDELDLGEARRAALAAVRARFGAGEDGWRRAQAAGGCSWWTYRNWDDITKNVQPQARSLLKTAIACGVKNPMAAMFG
jgi:hypothetical protein